MIDLVVNYEKMCEAIKRAQENHSTQAPVTLLAVSKTKPASMIRTLYEQGHRDFGENYLQECLGKQSELLDLNIIWHYIGSIQRNKTKDIAKNFDWVHTVDRAIIAKRFSDQRPESLPDLNICIQINIDAEDTKSGCLPEQAFDLVQQIQHYPRLALRGLMVIPSKDNSDAFIRTKALFDEIGEQFAIPKWDTLSMGMSNDFVEAIEHHATIIRVGSAIFGVRD